MRSPPEIDGLGAADAVAKNARARSRLVLADDHAEVLDEICRLLKSEFDVLRAVNQGIALIEAAAELRPDAVISDIQMPRLDGIAAGSQILQKGLCEAVVILTMHDEPQLVTRSLQAGLRGYVLKVDAGEELIPAVYAVLRGETYISSSASRSRGNSRKGGLPDLRP